jgi:hypothetical protein
MHPFAPWRRLLVASSLATSATSFTSFASPAVTTCRAAMCLGAVEPTAGMALTVAVDGRVGAVGLVDHGRVEDGDVRGTPQPEPIGVSEGSVEQSLVMAALDQLVRAATGPDRLADGPSGVDPLARC